VAGILAEPPVVQPPQPRPAPTTVPASGPAAETVKDIPDLVKQLDADNYKVREAAQEKLTRLLASEPAAVGKALDDALTAGRLSPEQKLRVENVLSTTRPARITPRISVVAGIMVVGPNDQ
jgi:hypothetical protein